MDIQTNQTSITQLLKSTNKDVFKNYSSNNTSIHIPCAIISIIFLAISISALYSRMLIVELSSYVTEVKTAQVVCETNSKTLFPSQYLIIDQKKKINITFDSYKNKLKCNSNRKYEIKYIKDQPKTFYIPELNGPTISFVFFINFILFLISSVITLFLYKTNTKINNIRKSGNYVTVKMIDKFELFEYEKPKSHKKYTLYNPYFEYEISKGKKILFLGNGQIQKPNYEEENFKYSYRLFIIDELDMKYYIDKIKR